MYYYAITLMVLISCAGEPKTPAASGTPEVQEMKASVDQQAPSPAALVARFTKYQIAVVRKGPKWTADAPKKIQELSSKNQSSWKALVDQGKLLGIAHLVEPGDIWGLIFFKVESMDEMKSIAANAPSVKAGLLAAEIRTVWGSRGLGSGLAEAAKGKMQMEGKPKSYYLVVMQKGPKWSDKADAPETREASGDAMKFMYDLYKEGYLRYYAALEDGSLKVRNISILNVQSAEEALKLVNESPAVKQGWHVPSVYEVKIPDGVIP
jgi:hypothetical protein